MGVVSGVVASPRGLGPHDWAPHALTAAGQGRAVVTASHLGVDLADGAALTLPLDQVALVRRDAAVVVCAHDAAGPMWLRLAADAGTVGDLADAVARAAARAHTARTTDVAWARHLDSIIGDGAGARADLAGEAERWEPAAGDLASADPAAAGTGASPPAATGTAGGHGRPPFPQPDSDGWAAGSAGGPVLPPGGVVPPTGAPASSGAPPATPPGGPGHPPAGAPLPADPFASWSARSAGGPVPAAQGEWPPVAAPAPPSSPGAPPAAPGGGMGHQPGDVPPPADPFASWSADPPGADEAGPPPCWRCRTVPQPGDVFCAGCGAPVARPHS